MPLPKIIFCENHFDPSTIAIIAKITPELKRLGYEVFYAEQPSSWTAEDHIEQIEYQETIQSHLSPYELRALSSAKTQDLVEADIKYAKQRSHYFSLYKSFLYGLEKKQIEYVGIDVPRVSEDYKDYISGESFELRDKRMGKAYLHEERPVFGFIGALHARGMQQKILEQRPKEDASSLFYFVHIYKEAPMHDFEKALRSGEINHPLGLDIYNANEMSDEEIIAAILQQASQLAEQAQTEPMKKKRKDKETAQKEKTCRYEKLPYQTKYGLLTSIKNLFSEEGVYTNSLLSNLDPEGEKYRQELMDFIAKPQYYDAIIDKLEILGRKAQRDHERRKDIFSFFNPIFPESKFQTLTHELIKYYKRIPPIDINNTEIDWKSIGRAKKEPEIFNPGYNWKP